ncbi:MAG: hypothetical protein AABX80_00370 [Nanoarchaeota archaeon]
MNNINIIQVRKCKKCLTEKSICDFGKHRHKCKKCENIYKSERNLITGKTKNKDGTRKKHKPKYDLNGQKFSKLTVLEFTGIKNNPSQSGKRASFFKCRCDCGKEKEIAAVYLKSGNVKSCGCLCNGKMGERSKKWTGYKGLSGTSWNNIQRNCINHIRSKRRNLEFAITKEYIWNLYEKQNRKCAISGLDIILDVGSKIRNQTASLDRIDSSKGYTDTNVQWVHKDVNYMKQDYSDEYFIETCKKISDFQRSKSK